MAAAQYNIAANHIDNVQIIRMAAEEFTQAMNGVRQFNRLQGIDRIAISAKPSSSIHRAAAGQRDGKMVQAYPRILYISCNPETLCRNLETLSQTHNVTRLALFDQFPYPSHGVRRPADQPKTGNVILPVLPLAAYSAAVSLRLRIL